MEWSELYWYAGTNDLHEHYVYLGLCDLMLNEFINACVEWKDDNRFISYK